MGSGEYAGGAHNTSQTLDAPPARRPPPSSKAQACQPDSAKVTAAAAQGQDSGVGHHTPVRPGPRTARKRALASHADRRAPRRPGPECRAARGAQEAKAAWAGLHVSRAHAPGPRARVGRLGLVPRPRQPSRRRSEPGPSGGNPPPALNFQPAPAREGLPELVSPAPSGGSAGKPGASSGVQGPVTESGRIFSDPVMSRHGPRLGQGGKEPAHGSARGSTSSSLLQGGPLNSRT